ncbi:hypothetical protein TNCT_65381 [Trichonephila clavata]|uniref:Uncharacterized protein n=1 Tax=Trichonephila clavata TaxID=2740835 RepID=A0A8X6LLV4_TRICU|nr:hypothetical protein TNCT_65381 [Trichonephila clavata]
MSSFSCRSKYYIQDWTYAVEQEGCYIEHLLDKAPEIRVHESRKEWMNIPVSEQRKRRIRGWRAEQFLRPKQTFSPIKYMGHSIALQQVERGGGHPIYSMKNSACMKFKMQLHQYSEILLTINIQSYQV